MTDSGSGSPDAKAGTGTRREDARPPRVLVVDDEHVVVDSLKKVLDYSGLAMVSAANVDEARECLENGDWAALITDLMMPGESGEVLLEEAGRTLPGLPVVVITGYGTQDLTLKMVLEGAVDFLPKPFTFEELLALAVRLARIIALDAPSRVALLSRKPRPLGDDEARPTGLDGNVGPAGRERGMPASRYGLGGHSWVEIEPHGAARIGAGPILRCTAGTLARIEVPEAGAPLVMGQPCACLVDEEGHEHALRAPLSGRVLETPPFDLDALAKDRRLPVGFGPDAHLLRMIPDRLEQERPLLIEDPENDPTRSDQ